MPKYDATYKIGNTTVHVVAPKNMTQEDIQKVLDHNMEVNWAIWDSLPREKQLELNAEAEKENQRKAD